MPTEIGKRRLCVYNAGFLTQPRIRRILSLAGWEVAVGVPGSGDAVGVWGASPTAPRGKAVARASKAPLVRVEDAFLRSLHPGRGGEPPLGLLVDETGVHFAYDHPSDLETLLADHPLDDPDLLDRARSAMAFMARHHLSKYAATEPDLPRPDPGFILVIDQTKGDAAVTASGGSVAAFQAMLETARTEHPDTPILVKTHPESDAGHRQGHFDPTSLPDGVTPLTGPVSPWALFADASAVYTFSSGLGFEAILAGHTPHVFGRPFYAGWGLSADRTLLPRRTRTLSREQLFAAAMILYPVWYDPYDDRQAELEDVLRSLAAQARAWREDRHGWVAHGMSRWKRPHLRAIFGSVQPLRFDVPDASRRHMVWAGAARAGDRRVRVEDGFLRSRGLGAALTPPMSLALDDLGIYYDPREESRLERMITQSVTLSGAEIERSRCLVARITDLGLSKYNISGSALPDLPEGPRILVVGQVEDDASVLTGAGTITTNAQLLDEARATHPDAHLLYKPHPDVEAGHRKGRLDRFPPGTVVLSGSDPAVLLRTVEMVWTMTSLLGFEALLRGIPVTTTGAPFYAGWGLTCDLGPIPTRRKARPTLLQLAHAALIDYPRYHDPISGLPCPPEVLVNRLASGQTPAPAGVLARLQAIRPRRD